MTHLSPAVIQSAAGSSRLASTPVVETLWRRPPEMAFAESQVVDRKQLPARTGGGNRPEVKSQLSHCVYTTYWK